MWIWKVNGFSEAQVKYLITIQTKLYYIFFSKFYLFQNWDPKWSSKQTKTISSTCSRNYITYSSSLISIISICPFNQTVTWKDLSYRVI